MRRISDAGRRKPPVFAHRGSHARFPENTIAAFTAGFALGADGIECDVQKTADGRFVVIHDSPRAAPPAARPPSLAEMLAGLPPDRLLDLELKGDTLVPADCPRILAEIVASRLDPDALLVTSFVAELLPAWKAWGIRTGLLVGEEMARLGIRGALALVRRLRPDWLCVPVQVFGRLGSVPARLLLRLARLAGYRVAFWTVDTAEDLGMVRPFADAIITDDVELVLRLLGRAP